MTLDSMSQFFYPSVIFRHMGSKALYMEQRKSNRLCGLMRLLYPIPSVVPRSSVSRKQRLDGNGVDPLITVRRPNIMESPDWREDSYGHRRRLLDLNRAVLESGRFSNVSFLVGPERVQIKAHSLILAARSSVFEAMFSLTWAQSQASDDCNVTVEVPDTEPNSFRSFLMFLYTDAAKGFTVPVVVGVLYLGQKYDVPEVTGVCAAYLRTNIYVSTVVEIYYAAKLFDLPELEAAAMAFMLKNAADLTRHPEFLQLDLDTLSKLISSDSLILPEVSVFQSLLAWGKAECERQEISSTTENLRRLLESVLSLVRFPTMTSQEFASEIVPTGLLNNEEIIQVFLYLNSDGGRFPCTASFNDTPRPLPVITAWRPAGGSPVGVYMSSESCSPISLSYTVMPGHFEKTHEESLDFTVNRSVEILGVGLYGPDPDRLYSHKAYKTYSVDIQIFNYPNTSTAERNPARALVSHASQSVSTRADYACYFVRPVIVEKDTLHHVRIAFKGQETKHGVTRLSNVSAVCIGTDDDEKVTFHFLGPPAPLAVGPGRHEGRIRSLFFQLITKNYN